MDRPLPAQPCGTCSLRSGEAGPPAHAPRRVPRDASTPTARHRRSTTAHVVLTYRELAAAGRSTGAAALHAAGRRARATGSACGSPSGTAELYVAILGVLAGRRGVRARSTPTTPTSGPGWSSARPTWPPSSATTWRSRSTRGAPARRPGASRRRPTTTPGSSSPRARPARRRASRSRTARAAAFVDAEARLFLQDAPLGPGRPGAGRAVGRVRRLLRGDVAGLARTAPAWCPAPRSLVRSGMDLGPWLVAQRHHRRLDGADARRRSGRPTALADVRLLIFGGEACPPELGRAAGRRRPRGVEHLRPDRGHRRRLRRPARPATGPVRIGLPLDGWDLAVVDARRAAGRRGRDRRADHRRRRARPLPRPGEGRREVRRRCRRSAGTAPTAAATSSASTAEGLLFLGPRRRPGQARRPADRARRGRRRAAGAARGAPARRPRCARTAAGQPGPRRLRRRPQRRASTTRRRRAALRERAAGRARAAARRRRRPADPHLGQGRPGRAAVAAAERVADDRRRRRSSPGTAAWLAEQWTAGPRGRGRPARTTTSSTTAAAASRPPSWCRGCATRYPEVTVADVYDNPRLGRPGRRRWTSSTPPVEAGDRATSRPTPRRDAGRCRALLQRAAARPWSGCAG